MLDADEDFTLDDESEEEKLDAGEQGAVGSGSGESAGAALRTAGKDIAKDMRAAAKAKPKSTDKSDAEIAASLEAKKSAPVSGVKGPHHLKPLGAGGLGGGGLKPQLGKLALGKPIGDAPWDENGAPKGLNFGSSADPLLGGKK